MAIEIISKLKPKNNGNFKLVDAKDVEYNNDGMEGITNVSDAIDRVYGILNADPVLSYINESDAKQYWAIGDKPYIQCSYTTPITGKYTLTVTVNGTPYITKKQNDKLINISLPEVTSEGKYIYRVTVSDNVGNINTKEFEFIYGGVSLSSTFDAVLNSTIYTINKTSYLSIPIKIKYGETGEGYDRTIICDIYNNSGENICTKSYNLGNDAEEISETINLDYEFDNKGTYVLKIKGFVGADNIKSNELEYVFSVLSENSIAATIASKPKSDLDTNSPISLSYRIITNIDEHKNQLRANLKLYKINNGGADTLVKDLYEYNIISGNTKTWSIGRLNNAGDYRVEIYGQPANGNTNGIVVDHAVYEMNIAQSENSGYDYYKNNLIAYFDAEDKDNSDNNPDIWEAKGNPNYYIKLHGLDYNTNGWKTADDDGLKMLSFTGDSWGEMKYKYTDASGSYDVPYKPMSIVTDASEGHTLEIVFRSKCIGELDADVLTCRNDNEPTSTGGYTLKYNSAEITAVNGKSTSRTLSEDRWTHVCFVLDKNIRELNKGTNKVTNKDIEDLNTAPTMRIYIDGCLSACNVITKWEFFADEIDGSKAMQLLLNAAYNSSKQPDKFGCCDIKLLRLYSVPLKSSQVFGNYVNSIRNTDIQRTLQDKNDSSYADVPIIHFVKNKIPFIKDPEKFSKASTFTELHEITKKKSEDASEATSKNSWINCTMWYKYKDMNGEWETEVYNDVDVYLQGTSSLTYPVKNYQIKLYDSTIGANEERIRGSKLKIIPPNKSNDLGWVTEDNVFTLKCDYMEQSHKNNTCTAIFYEELMDAIQDIDVVRTKPENDRISIAKQQKTTKQIVSDGGESSTVEINKFRDAINGFPVIVYYNDNNTNDDANIPDPETDEYIENSQDIFAGTYMFNVDKEGKQLGFEIDIESPEPLTYVNDAGETIQLKDKDGNNLTRDIMPCISLEGSSNSSFAAASAFYTLEEYQEQLEDDRWYFDEKGELKEREIFEDNYAYIEATLEPRFSYADDFEDTLIESYGKNETKNIIKHLNFDRIAEIIEWVSANSDNKDTFRAEFGNYFSFTYCLAYYLQMMVFTQVDNAGKNAMFDSWGGVFYPRPYDMDTQMGLNNSGVDVILPSAEINSSMSNESITGSFANVAWIKSGLPTKDGDNDIPYNPNNHLRFSQYNTRTSKLWNAFATHFYDEITKAYAALRTAKIYDVDYICTLVESYTSDVIGETFYNKDAASKYLNTMGVNEDGTIDPKYLYACQGNRSSRYRQFLEQRLIFLDTKFGYKVNNLNTDIVLRSDVPSGTGNKSAIVGLSVYSPQYITISIGTDCTVTVYVDTSSEYELNGIKYNGALINLPFEADTKDWTISGAGNIKTIDHMPGLCLELCQIGNARKLTNVAITNSNILKEFSVDTNTYLRSLNLSGNTLIKDAINLEKCRNLKTLNISNSSIPGITLPNGAPLSNINVKNCKIGALSLSGLQFIDVNGLDISGCNSLTSLSINNCPKITSLDISDLISLRSLNISNLQELTKIDLSTSKLTSLQISLCDKLNTIILDSCTGSVLNNLNLSTVYGLESLSLKNASYSNGISVLLPTYKSEYAEKSEEEIEELINNNINVRWDNLKYLYATSSNLIEVRYGLSNPNNPIVDLTPFTLIGSDFNGDKAVKKIIGYKTSGTLNSMFQSCSALVKVAGNVENCTNLNYTFNGCSKLEDLSELTIKSSRAIEAYYIFCNCKELSSDYVQKVLDSNTKITNLNHAFNSIICEDGLPPSISKLKELTSLNFAFKNCKTLTEVPDGYLNSNIKLKNAVDLFNGCNNLTKVPNTLFKQCKNLENIHGAFKGCISLTTFLNDGFNILPDPKESDPIEGVHSNSITDVSELFSGCTVLTMPTNDLYEFFKFSKNLIYAEDTFFNVPTLTSNHCVDGILRNNINLKSIHGLFYKCTGLTTVPTRLFYTGDTKPDNTTHTNLTNAAGVFAECTNLTGRVGKSLFTGAENIKSIGYDKSEQYISPEIATYRFVPGIFANTAIDSYDSDLLSGLTKLTNVSYLFAKGSMSSTDAIKTAPPLFNVSTPSENALSEILSRTYIPGKDNPVLQRWSEQIFSNNENIECAECAFAGNIGMIGFCDAEGNEQSEPKIFTKCKNKLKNVNGLFMRCGINETGESGAIGLIDPVYKTLFQDLSSLVDAKSVFMWCFAMQGSLTSDIFRGCTSLQNTTAMFYQCRQLGINDSTNDVSIPNNLFDSCRNTLVDVSYMFTYCGFAGRIGTGTAPIVNPETYEVESYENKGLLAECTNLTSTKSMFALCKNLKGAIPQDIFYTRDNTKEYRSLSDISEMFSNCYGLARFYGNNPILTGVPGGNPSNVYGEYMKYEDDEIYNLIPNNWLSRCPNITNIESIFCNIASRSADNKPTINETSGYDINNDYNVIITDSIFWNQMYIENANYAFANISTLTGSLSNEFMKSSLSKLKSAIAIFAQDNKLNSIGGDAENVIFQLSGSNVNVVLKNLTAAFYNCSSLTGYGIAIGKFKLTNANSMVYNCNNLDNYNNYTNTYKTENDNNYGTQAFNNKRTTYTFKSSISYN